jgi:hypothetical protein
MSFDTELIRDGSTLRGPVRAPVQMLADQVYDDHLSVHDESNAAALGLTGAPIEGPTHFSQFDPISVELFGEEWFRTGCISSHFSTMVVEGEEVVAEAERTGESSAAITATKTDGSTVLTGTISVAPHPETALEHRLANARPAGELFIVDQLHVGMTSSEGRTTSMDFDTNNGPLYPFSLRQKLEGITERSPWYSSGDNPWGRPIVPMEMLSVLANKIGDRMPVRQPSLGLFLDLEVRLVDGPVFLDTEYRVEREVVGLSQSRRVESHWVRSKLTEAETGRHAATVLLHSGVFKESYPDYPADRL